MQGDLAGAAQTVDMVTKKQNRRNSAKSPTLPERFAQVGDASRTPGKQVQAKSWMYLLLKRPYLRWLIGTAGAWLLLDIAYYGTTISSPLVLKSLNAHSSLVTNMLYTLLIFVVAALPGYIVAALTIDRLVQPTASSCQACVP